MGNDPAHSVVDPYGRAHDVPNLFVYDGSVFVTSSGFNPTATICAIALRCSLNLIETHNEVAT
jgi:choline dehydrogenase-like flavoprotein